MSRGECATTLGHSVRYLDIGPMIIALKFQPFDFVYTQGWLHHVPSRHRFQFDRKGGVSVDAHCSCAALPVKAEQARELHAMSQSWRRAYWQPLETSREFASHFAEPNAWVRLFREIHMALWRFRGHAAPVRIKARMLPSATPAE